MPDSRTVQEHLLDAREALEREVERLTSAIAGLDVVIGQVGGASRPVAPPSAVNSANGKPVNAAAAAEKPARSARASAARGSRGPAKRTTARRPSGSRSSAAAEPPTSIREHVLDMLAAEDRDFGLAEIIDRVHDAGIQAHDDAVRSITIKLMKDGSVERVGRGQYRLARRAPRGGTEGSTAANNGAAAATVDGQPSESRAPETPGPEPEDYTPPLDLGQPWEPGA